VVVIGYRQIHAWLERDSGGEGLPSRMRAGDGPATDVALG
jgi:hypothetical protein